MDHLYLKSFFSGIFIGTRNTTIMVTESFKEDCCSKIRKSFMTDEEIKTQVG